jgi:dTDP-4-amino-4,6-dideoxygalactose transaminase
VLNSRDGEDVVREYENQLAALIGPGRGVSFAAGRMAFYAVLKALGVGSNDEVILPGFTCSVMPNAVWRTGARPVFADIEAETFGSCASGIAAKITSRTKAVVAQHSFGIPCNIPEIVELCRKRGLALIEDCAITLDSFIWQESRTATRPFSPRTTANLLTPWWEVFVTPTTRRSLQRCGPLVRRRPS